MYKRAEAKIKVKADINLETFIGKNLYLVTH